MSASLVQQFIAEHDGELPRLADWPELLGPGVVACNLGNSCADVRLRPWHPDDLAPITIQTLKLMDEGGVVVRDGQA